MRLEEVAKSLTSPSECKAYLIRNIQWQQAKKVFSITKSHRLIRYIWAEAIMNQTLELFQYIVWSDECHVYVGGNSDTAMPQDPQINTYYIYNM